MDLTDSALRTRVKQAEIDACRGADGELSTDEKAELRRFRRENRILQQERDFPRKSLQAQPINATASEGLRNPSVLRGR